jgi:uncharacterized membrane protein (DUF4010 family)
LDTLEIFQRLAVALAAGLLIGAEREHSPSIGSKPAGLRTFALTGLLGALWQLAGGIPVLGLGFLGFAVLMTAAHWLHARSVEDVGVTSEVAALTTFLLGALAMQGYLEVTAAAAVAMAALLGFKPQLHGLLRRLEQVELEAALKLLLLAVVILPVLPNRGLGPWAAVNPHDIGWFVVLTAFLSFAGYFAVKISDPRRGMMLTAILGGLVSSTVVSLHFARLSRQQAPLQAVLAAGVIAASTTAFLRVLLLASAVAPSLFRELAPPLLVMSLAGYAMAWWHWRGSAATAGSQTIVLNNPVEIAAALQFGAILAGIMLLTKALQAYLGTPGLFLLSAVSGLADVDAISLSLARLVPAELRPGLAAAGIILAVGVNTLVKAVLVGWLARRAMALRVIAALAVVMGIGLIAWASDLGPAGLSARG